MNSELQQSTHRHIRSFVRRTGRETPAQRLVRIQLTNQYCLDPQPTFNVHEVFGRDAPIIMEIGFGNGAALAEIASANPNQDYLGIEVHTPGIGHLMRQLQQLSLSNVRIYSDDAVDILNRVITDNSLDGVHIFFPDPWHKKRHRKRRLINTNFLQLIARKLKLGGYFHAATDWEDYAYNMIDLLEACTQFENIGSGFAQRPVSRPLTKFEQRGLRKGHPVWDLIFKHHSKNN